MDVEYRDGREVRATVRTKIRGEGLERGALVRHHVRALAGGPAEPDGIREGWVWGGQGIPRCRGPRRRELKPALDRRYRFDTIVSFEPVRECWAALEELADDRVEICRFGLGKESSPGTIYGAGLLGASIFPEAAVSGRSEVVQLQRASDWFMEHIRDGDEVYLTLNCEGSECDILEDLLESGEIRQGKSCLPRSR